MSRQEGPAEPQPSRFSRRGMFTTGGLFAAASVPVVASASPAFATPPWEDASAGAAFARLVVAAADAPEAMRQAAHYVCDGTADEVEINAAIDELTGGGNETGGSVLLTQGTFNVATPVLLRRYVCLAGVGWSTTLEPAAGNTASVLALADDAVSMTVVRDLVINGRHRSAHGIHYRQSAGDFGGIAAPDAQHQIVGVYVWGTGNASAPRDGIYLEGTGRGGGRASAIHSSRVREAFRHGVHVDGFSDCHISDVHSNTNDDGDGHAFLVGGGSAMLANCKGWYTGSDAFFVRSSRAQLVNCQAQDAGRNGFRLTSSAGTILTSCTADSCGRLQAGDGFRVEGSTMMLTGLLALDRGQSPESPQQYGFRFTDGAGDISLTGTATANAAGALAGAPGGQTYLRVVESGVGVIKIG